MFSRSSVEIIESSESSLTIKVNYSVETQADLFRPTDIAESHANPQRAADILGWRAKHDVRDVVKFMVDRVY